MIIFYYPYVLAIILFQTVAKMQEEVAQLRNRVQAQQKKVIPESKETKSIPNVSSVEKKEEGKSTSAECKEETCPETLQMNDKNLREHDKAMLRNAASNGAATTATLSPQNSDESTHVLSQNAPAACHSTRAFGMPPSHPTPFPFVNIGGAPVKFVRAPFFPAAVPRLHPMDYPVAPPPPTDFSPLSSMGRYHHAAALAADAHWAAGFPVPPHISNGSSSSSVMAYHNHHRVMSRLYAPPSFGPHIGYSGVVPRGMQYGYPAMYAPRVPYPMPPYGPLCAPPGYDSRYLVPNDARVRELDSVSSNQGHDKNGALEGSRGGDKRCNVQAESMFEKSQSNTKAENTQIRSEENHVKTQKPSEADPQANSADEKKMQSN